MNTKELLSGLVLVTDGGPAPGANDREDDDVRMVGESRADVPARATREQLVQVAVCAAALFQPPFQRGAVIRLGKDAAERLAFDRLREALSEADVSFEEYT